MKTIKSTSRPQLILLVFLIFFFCGMSDTNAGYRCSKCYWNQQKSYPIVICDWAGPTTLTKVINKGSNLHFDASVTGAATGTISVKDKSGRELINHLYRFVDPGIPRGSDIPGSTLPENYPFTVSLTFNCRFKNLQTIGGSLSVRSSIEME